MVGGRETTIGRCGVCRRSRGAPLDEPPEPAAGVSIDMIRPRPGVGIARGGVDALLGGEGALTSSDFSDTGSISGLVGASAASSCGAEGAGSSMVVSEGGCSSSTRVGMVPAFSFLDRDFGRLGRLGRGTGVGRVIAGGGIGGAAVRGAPGFTLPLTRSSASC